VLKTSKHFGLKNDNFIKKSQEMFERILYIWAMRHPASGYVQGINDLVTPFFVVFLQEIIPPGILFFNGVVSIR
jgi:hypothetical protein